MNSISSSHFAWTKPLIAHLFITAGTSALFHLICSKSIEQYNDKNVKKSQNQEKAERLSIVAGAILGAFIGYTLHKNWIGLVSTLNLATNNLEKSNTVLAQQLTIINLQNQFAGEQCRLLVELEAARNTTVEGLTTKLDEAKESLAKMQGILNLQNDAANVLLSTIDKVKTFFIKLGLMNTDLTVNYEGTDGLNVTGDFLKLGLHQK